MTVQDDRTVAVATTIDRIREVERDQGVTLGALENIKGLLLELADDRNLFPLADFPVTEEDGTGAIYRLSEDEDHRHALYASAAVPGKAVPPHNHTTWAVIVGVHGDEENRFYERTDDGATAGHGALRQISETTVRHGSGVTLMPDDIHSIHVTGDGQTVLLHMYGLALEQLHERVMYNPADNTYAVFPATQNIK